MTSGPRSGAVTPLRGPGRGRPLESPGWALLFVAPLLTGVAVFYYYPILANLLSSFQHSSVFGQKTSWVGIDNYIQLFARPDLGSAVGNTLLYTGILLLGIPISIVVAAMIELPGLRFSKVYRILFFMPYLAMPMAISQVWRLVFNGQFGLINQVLQLLGVKDPPYWLATPGLTILVVSLFGIWSSIGFNVIILSAGLKDIPREIYEAASLDGASPVQAFRSITVPLLTPSIFFLAVTTTIAGFQLFDALFAMLGPVNPAMPQSRSLVYLFYQEAFINNDKGTGAAVAVLLTVLVAVVTAIQFWGQRRWVHYE
jgi:multiple sugar transport system permease protein